jgi:hypothetical protein
MHLFATSTPEQALAVGKAAAVTEVPPAAAERLTVAAAERGRRE